MSDTNDKYEKLKKQLVEGFSWPTVYMFKFIVPAQNKNLAQLESLFNSEESEISIRQSKTGKFISLTAKEMMLDADKVIDRYIAAESIEGIIAL